MKKRDAGFFIEVRKAIEGKAKDKGYGQELEDFMAKALPDHALGEIIYKAVRYSRKHDKEDLIKLRRGPT